LAIVAVAAGFQALRLVSSGSSTLTYWIVMLAAIALLTMLSRSKLRAFAADEVQLLKDFVLRTCDARMVDER